MRVRFRPQGERAFPLESRHLCTAAAVAAPTTPPIVQDLGLVGPQLAETGLRATATISEGSSVAFRLVLKQGGDFVLFFKHEGPAGVTLKAQTPGGEANLDPGPAGSFEAVRLQLPAGEYVLTPSNTGPGSLFVDWDLVLANGIGQGPAAMLRLTDATPVAPSLALAPTPPLAVSYNTAGAKGRDGLPVSPANLAIAPGGTLVGRAVGESVLSEPRSDDGVTDGESLAQGSAETPNRGAESVAEAETGGALSTSDLATLVIDLGEQTVADRVAIAASDGSAAIGEIMSVMFTHKDAAGHDVEAGEPTGSEPNNPSETPGEPVQIWRAGLHGAWVIPATLMAVKVPKRFLRVKRSDETPEPPADPSAEDRPGMPALPKWQRNSMSFQGPCRSSMFLPWKRNSMMDVDRR